MPKLITPTVLAVNMLAALWLAVCALPQRDRDVREAERSDQRAAALEDRAHVVDSLTALRAEADSQAAVRVRALEGTAARARSVMRSESVRGDSLDALLAVHLAADSLPDTLVVLIRSTLAARDSGLPLLTLALGVWLGVLPVRLATLHQSRRSVFTGPGILWALPVTVMLAVGLLGGGVWTGFQLGVLVAR